MTIYRLFTIFSIGALLANCATQTDISANQEKWHPRDAYFQVLSTEELELEAEIGDREALFHLAIRLMNGDRIGRDEEKAVRVAREGAESGDAPSQYLLGAALAAGSGVPKDEAEAVKWFKKSAKQGYVTAEYWYGFMHSRGRGVEKVDWEEGLKWIRKAAEKGHEDAQATMGTAYDSCLGGMPRDFEKAAMWYRRADRSGRGHMMSRYNLRRLIDIGAVEWQEGDGGAPPIELVEIDRSYLDPCAYEQD